MPVFGHAFSLEIRHTAVLEIHLEPRELLLIWKRIGVLADFIAGFVEQGNPSLTYRDRIETISFVFNEFLENAAKYSLKRSSIHIQMEQNEDSLVICIVSLTQKSNALSFQHILETLFGADDLETLYFQKLEEKTEESQDSGIGLLLILKDYPDVHCSFSVEEKTEGNYEVKQAFRVAG